MKTKLLATVAMTTLIGCTSFAVAQNREGGAPQSQGAQQHQMGNPGGAGSPGGAMSNPSGGNAQTEPSTANPQASGEQNKSFSQEEPNKSSTAPKGQPNKNVSQEESNKSSTATKGQQDKSVSQEERNKSSTQRGTEEHGAQNNESGHAGTNETQGRTGQAQQNGAPGRSGAASVQLSEQQRNQIKDIVVSDHNVARVNNVNFNISVGVAVPRTVHVAVLPAEVVTIVPEYRGFEYVVVGDQLLIIDPNTLEIVAILPA
jgi:Protein of unknown function (DUF1236)